MSPHLHPWLRWKWARAVGQATDTHATLYPHLDTAETPFEHGYRIEVVVFGATRVEAAALFDVVTDRAHAFGCIAGLELAGFGAPNDDDGAT